ncbi:plasmid segregation protein ParM [Plantibacter flavus]|uniref:Plasmid segregation protein ParM n=1 Tax=Plantibacter flavus TaxID=150123 RepID=A0A3N2BLK5_9MICO|nr:ParM/StbA family protein [Plantibacter flavus]ROR76088.1 plasmid segregation protein ParM [Plantibacter flavus]SMG48664.1 plasmid segregation protein ParM [Plantibacter flavus]
MSKHKITGGIDVGNGYVKAALRGLDGRAEKFDIPSGVALVTGAVDLPTPDSAASDVLAAGIFNELDVTFASSLVPSTHRHLFGRRALKAQTPRFEEFDVVSGISKAEQSLAKVLILGLFAGKAVSDHVAKTGSLPDETLEVEARVALALPIDEYREHRFGYQESFKEGVHLVTVLNFETPVIVRIIFVDVQVAAEGASAQFAIRQHGVTLIDSMLEDVRAKGQPLEGITGQDIHDATSTVGIDIGEGTVNFPVFSDAKFNGDASRTFDKGYGTVLLNSLTPLKRAKLPFNSRKALADYLLSTPSPLKRAEHAKVAAIVSEQAALFSEQVVEEFRKILAEVGRDTEVVYVFGGGSGSVREFLHPLLLEVVPEGTPVLFLDVSYSRHLNREGLLIAATLVEESANKAAPAKGAAKLVAA